MARARKIREKGFTVYFQSGYRDNDATTRPTLGMDASLVSPTKRCSRHGMKPRMLTRTLKAQGPSRLLPNNGGHYSDYDVKTI